MTVRLDNIKMTIVTDSFKKAVKEIVSKKVLMLEAQRSSIPDNDAYTRQQREATTKNIQVAKHLLTECGQDRMITAIKRMKFEKFYYSKAPNGEVYLCSKTRDMILNIHGKKYNVGPYHICIGASAILGSSLDQVHMFPDKAPMDEYRHLHHGARLPSGTVRHPLMMRTNTCWGNVGGSFISAKNEADIADMFRVLYIYISRLNFSSPLYSEWVQRAYSYGVAV